MKYKTGVCIECGDKYPMTRRDRIYCKRKCQLKYNNRRLDKRFLLEHGISRTAFRYRNNSDYKKYTEKYREEHKEYFSEHGKKWRTEHPEYYKNYEIST